MGICGSYLHYLHLLFVSPLPPLFIFLLIYIIFYTILIINIRINILINNNIYVYIISGKREKEEEEEVIFTEKFIDIFNEIARVFIVH